MKNLIIAMGVFVAIASKAQTNTTITDSVKTPKNEIGFNLLPIVNMFGGALPIESSRYSLNYRHYLNLKSAMRVTVSVFPYEAYRTFREIGTLSFYQLSDTMLIYKNVQNKQKAKLQLNVGYERVFVSKKLIQSVGADIYLNYQHLESKETYYWTGKSSPLPNSTYEADLSNKKIDTMGVNKVMDRIGFGIQPFYNLRIPISKRLIISTTVGPGLSVTRSKDKITSSKAGSVFISYGTNFDFEAILFSDLSICYRF